MAVYTKVILSGSTDGRPIPVAATSTPGTTLHTAHATAIDEVHLWAVNSDTVDRKLTLELGGTTAPDDLVELTVPAETGLLLVLPGMPFSNSKVIKAFAA